MNQQSTTEKAHTPPCTCGGGGYVGSGFEPHEPTCPQALKETVMPEADAMSNCGECGGPIQYVVCDQWAGDHVEILDAWWAHNVHSSDGHGARPAGVTTPPG